MFDMAAFVLPCSSQAPSMTPATSAPLLCSTPTANQLRSAARLQITQSADKHLSAAIAAKSSSSCTSSTTSLPTASFGLASTVLGISCAAAAVRRRRRTSSRPGPAVSLAAVGQDTDVLEKRLLKASPYPKEKPQIGDIVKMHYVAYLEDGTVFDSSRARKEPFEFHVGEAEVIDGWDMLVPTMAYKERAELVIGSRYAYGEEGVHPWIPPNETLTFDVELLDFGTPQEDEDDDANKDVIPEAEEEDEVDADGIATGEKKLWWDEEPEREYGVGNGWQWKASGTGAEINVYVPLPEDLKVSDLKVDIRTFKLVCQIGAGEAGKVFDDEIFAGINMDDSHWDIEKREDGAVLIITMEKIDKSLRWDSLLKAGDGGPQAEAVPVEQADAEVVEGRSRGGAASGGKASEVVDVDVGSESGSGKTVKPRRK
eukprot:TRINITY_DN80167_c0_g1_i1.p1 TRINITY_DN80167_c0_g1~~TRINITY_DN80167_c0_g1_i1.p1  ORF type:complete len:427 (+),score=100.68 TRINITY_DN80167_c0_g1_i1:41-1321(+)